MKKSLLVLSFFCCITTFLVAQNDVLNGIYVKEHVPARKPVPYHFLREADMAWTKTIWRMLELKEKLNHPLYYPTETDIMDDRFSLFGLLYYGIKNEGTVVYNFGERDEFMAPMTLTEIELKLGMSEDTIYQEDEETGEITPRLIKNEIKPEEMTRLLMKEIWYFDKQRSMLECRIVGLCPIRMFAKSDDSGSSEEDGEEKELTMSPAFWVYYPSVRPLLANHEVFNANNDAERRTFDDIFFKRRFSSFIFKETNVYNNRFISTYRKGLDALLESEKVKDFIFKFEHDLWEY